MPNIPAAAGAARRLISREGEPVTLTTRTVTVDTSTDWDDETTETESTSVTGLVTRTRGAGELVGSETGTDTNVDFIVWLDPDDVSDVTVRDSSTDQPPTEATFNGDTYEVVLVDGSIDGVLRLEVSR